MYITSDDYQQLTGKEAPENFKHLEMMASAELNSVTRFYFEFNELADDLKSKQFKKAMAIQISFLASNEMMTVEELNNQPDSVRMGDTTVTYNRTGTGAEVRKRHSALSGDALNALRGTGLLYRGVRHA